LQGPPLPLFPPLHELAFSFAALKRGKQLKPDEAAAAATKLLRKRDMCGKVEDVERMPERFSDPDR
jgi:hypothetical protein